MKIGVAIIACDRVDYTKQCIEHLLKNGNNISEKILVNDGQKIPYYNLLDPRKQPEIYDDKFADIQVYNNDPPYQSVGKAKNKALFELMKRRCDGIFLIENDILIKDPKVFETYINTANATGITHLNFGYHGPANRMQDNYDIINPRYIVEYPGNVKVNLNLHCVGAFSYFNKRYIEEVGTHDTYFKNAWEHVELCQRGIEKGLLPAFWWFPDIAGSEKMLQEIPGSIEKSSITHTPEWIENMQKGAAYYKKLHGWTPVETPDTPLEKVLANLKNIYTKNANVRNTPID